ncbi:MAG: GNAT family N-acetyltransferase [Bdellovibrionales bacterium CG12_big_fil_rev_8_21_14_0_65_38_15]|nr:MAG: GNAT family N-acetyltransferase [Bdellovibrionales bacterium CG22_combo_CG10-13_8_21_14_all_38_13]PIQ54577.1 MAG: GNAT family N-acetyltransferase [Bdellovibrionales bacterium CG12_big_fil_rev_8_21_14_0_65_38_15]PIR29958.1 MAG: GNAT family N-acetyltransferase [Bdellovibrionales bacterium CG11_big_fil_rev_8_21_14_0_20_38_13]
MIIRKLFLTDAIPLAELFFNTIRTVNLGDYTQEQVEAWAPQKRDLDSWTRSFSGKNIFIADDNGVHAGFGEIKDNGYIDRFYIAQQYIGRGVGKTIYQAIEDYARAKNIDKIFVEASITAKPFFIKMGFIEINEQVVLLRGVKFKNFYMEKTLN